MKVITMTREEFGEMYYNFRNKDVCHKLGMSVPTLHKLLRKYNIPLKGRGNRSVISRIKISN